MVSGGQQSEKYPQGCRDRGTILALLPGCPDRRRRGRWSGVPNPYQSKTIDLVHTLVYVG